MVERRNQNCTTKGMAKSNLPSQQIAITLSAFMLVLMFQNCSPSGLSSSLDASAIRQSGLTSLNSGQVFVDARLANTNATPLSPDPFSIHDIQAILFDDALTKNFRYRLDLNNGVLSGPNGLSRVLSVGDLSAVRDTLTGATLTNLHLLQPDLLCTMDYLLPYAAIEVDQSIQILGEGSSGCPNQDLYKGQNVSIASDLIQLLRSLVSN